MRISWIAAIAVLSTVPALAQQSQTGGPVGADPAGSGQEGAAAAPASGDPAAAQPAAGDAADESAESQQSASAAEIAISGPLEFRTILGDKPIQIVGDDASPAFEEFRATGVNPFAGDEEALAEGKKLYARLCQACHLPDGSGRIGPSLRDDEWRHPRIGTQGGRFEVIHSGGAGAMQAFHNRMSTDEILKVMAWIDTFREGG